MRISKTLLCLSLGIIASLAASAAAEVAVLFNHAVPPVEFAVRDISKALGGRGDSATLKNLETAAPSAGTSRIIIASSAEKQRGFP